MNASGFELLLRIDSGVDAGAIYQVMGSHIRIGRAEDNDIVLHDIKASRYHASIEFQGPALVIKNLSKTQSIQVDGKTITGQSYLEINSEILIGSTKLSLVQESALIDGPQKDLSNAAPQKKKKPLFYIYIGLGLLFTYLLLSETETTTAQKPLRDTKAIQEEIAESKKIAEALENAKFTSGKDTKQYQDAQESYLKAFRDYRGGNYARAITSFEATLALYPKHPLAKHYLNLSKRKLDEQIQIFMQEGNRYMSKGKYKFAISSFKNAMILIKNPSDPNYKEAYAKYRESMAIIEEGF